MLNKGATDSEPQKSHLTESEPSLSNPDLNKTSYLQDVGREEQNSPLSPTLTIREVVKKIDVEKSTPASPGQKSESSIKNARTKIQNVLINH